MHTPCILIGNEPRCYREAIALTVQHLRPRVRVIALQPHELDRAIQHLEPDMVVRDELPDPSNIAGPWIVLYPHGQPVSIVNVAGQRFETSSMDLAMLMAYVDKALLTQMG